MLAAIQPSALQSFYRGRRVLVTGHSGFKGAWLALWLERMGAEVYGLALPPDQGPDNLFERAGVASAVNSAFVDIRDAGAVLRRVGEVRPELIFHLAARAWVQQGYEDPVATFAANTMGVAHVLEAARQTPSVRAVVCVTTDKVYRNNEGRPYLETDELGGPDPYSASKAAAELVVRAYSQTLRPKDRRLAVATARGGNVIGGGDWSPHRIVPDIVRALAKGEPLRLRQPAAIRPWQHVLDLCNAYLVLGHRLMTDGPEPGGADQAWNFGPGRQSETAVADLVRLFLSTWGQPDYPIEQVGLANYESEVLRLDAAKANRDLGWRPVLDRTATIEWTADWYRRYLDDSSAARRLVDDQLSAFERRAAADAKTKLDVSAG